MRSISILSLLVLSLSTAFAIDPVIPVSPTPNEVPVVVLIYQDSALGTAGSDQALDTTKYSGSLQDGDGILGLAHTRIDRNGSHAGLSTTGITFGHIFANDSSSTLIFGVGGNFSNGSDNGISRYFDTNTTTTTNTITTPGTAGTPAIPGTEGTPAIPGTEGTPATLGHIPGKGHHYGFQKPGHHIPKPFLGTPGTPGTAGTPAVPGTAGTPAVPGTDGSSVTTTTTTTTKTIHSQKNYQDTSDIVGLVYLEAARRLDHTDHLRTEFLALGSLDSQVSVAADLEVRESIHDNSQNGPVALFVGLRGQVREGDYRSDIASDAAAAERGVWVDVGAQLGSFSFSVLHKPETDESIGAIALTLGL